MATFKPRYHRKHSTASRPSQERRRKAYRKYYQQQPSQVAYVEEPTSDSESESEVSEVEIYPSSDESSSDEEVYEFDLSENESDSDSDEDFDYYVDSRNNQVLVDSTGREYIVDMNDELENDAVDQLEADGEVYDLNDELVRYYDSDSECEPEDILDVVDLNDQLQAEALQQAIEYSSESDSESETDSESEDSYMEYSSDEEHLNQQLALECIRQGFADSLVSEDEIELSCSEDSVEGEQFFEVDSDFYSSEDEDDVEFDAGNPENYEYYESDSSESSDDEGITIYRHRFDLPDGYDSEEDSTDEELQDINEQFMLRADDSDDEWEVIDLSKDLENSKDCEVLEAEDHYKITLRFPVLKDECKVNFLKNENELVVSGKFSISLEEESDEEEEVEAEVVLEEAEEAEAEDKEESKESSSSESSSSSDSESDSDSDSSDSSSESDSSSSDSEEELDQEEIQEDAESLIKEFSNQEIKFEKHFQFDKLVKSEEIKAKFTSNDELELIVPKVNNDLIENNNTLQISIEKDEDESSTEEMEDALSQLADEDVAMKE